MSIENNRRDENRRHDRSQITDHESRITNNESRVTLDIT